MRGTDRILALVDRRRTLLLLASLFLILLGARAALINYAGNPTPFLDEWDADGAHLLQPYLEGHLTLGDLFHPINEHRIPFTKLLVLAIFNISGYWDVILQMIVNVTLDAALIVAFAYASSRVLHGGFAVAAMIVSIAINALPFGYDNAVLGFNTHFYLLLAFSLGGLWLLAHHRAWSPRWLAGALCGVASSQCLASGALTLGAAAAALLLQMACGRRSGVREGLGIAALAAIAIALVWAVPYEPQADELKAHSLGQFLGALVALASWPAHSILGLIFYLPSALFLGRLIAARAPLSDPRWFNVAALAWVGVQIFVLALGRAKDPLQYRYFDALLVGLSVNLVSAFWLFEKRAAALKAKRWPTLVLGAWLGLLAVSLVQPQRHLPGVIELWRTILANGEANVRNYNASGDPSYLKRAPAVEVPSFFPDDLRRMLDNPEIRSALPPALTLRAPPHPWLESFKRVFLQLGPLWLALGALLLALVAIPRAFEGGRRPRAILRIAPRRGGQAAGVPAVRSDNFS